MMVGGVVRSFALILVLTISAATAVSAAEARKQASLPSFEFRGHRIGEPIEQNFPYWAEGHRGLGLPYCADRRVNGIYDCDDPTIEVDEWMGNRVIGKRSIVGDVPVLGLRYVFLDGRLCGLHMYSDVKVYHRILGMLHGRYGKPQDEAVEPVQDDSGVWFQNVVSEWNFKEGVLQLHKRLSAKSSVLIFLNPKAEAEMERRDQAQNSMKGKQAF